MNQHPADPRNLGTHRSPAIVHLTDGEDIYVATQKVRDGGWLYVNFWDGESRKYPPHRIDHIEYVTTEMHPDDVSCTERSKRVADDALRQRAIEEGGLEVDDAQEQAAV